MRKVIIALIVLLMLGLLVSAYTQVLYGEDVVLGEDVVPNYPTTTTTLVYNGMIVEDSYIVDARLIK